MLWLLAALMTGYAMLLPVELAVYIRHHGQTQTRLILRIAWLHRTWTFSGFPGTDASARQSSGQRYLSALRSSDRAKAFLKRHTHIARLDALVLLRTGDAARTALLTGILRSITAAVPRRRVRICIQPDFFRDHSTVQIRCIIRWKLGTLLLTAGMLLAETLRRQRLTESEAT